MTAFCQVCFMPYFYTQSKGQGHSVDSSALRDLLSPPFLHSILPFFQLHWSLYSPPPKMPSTFAHQGWELLFLLPTVILYMILTYASLEIFVPMHCSEGFSDHTLWNYTTTPPQHSLSQCPVFVFPPNNYITFSTLCNLCICLACFLIHPAEILALLCKNLLLAHWCTSPVCMHT